MSPAHGRRIPILDCASTWNPRSDKSPFEMDAEHRAVVLQAIGDVCHHKQWSLLAAHVRSNHVHTVVDANDVAPEFVMNAFKSYASRALNLRSPMQKGRIRWARHGSTRYLWSRERLEAAMRYVLEKQGEPMACYRLPDSLTVAAHGCAVPKFHGKR